MDAGLLCSCHSSTQLISSGFQFSGQSRASSEPSSSSSSCASQLCGRVSSRKSAGHRFSMYPKKVSSSSVDIRCQGDWSHFKLPNQSKQSGEASKKPESGGVNRLPGFSSSTPGSWDSTPFRRNQVSPPGLGQFRPPPSSWVPDAEESEEERNQKEAKKAELLEKLSRGLGSWQEKAGDIKKLQQLGVTSEELYEFTFVAVPRQTALVVAHQVYESVAESGASAETLDWFDEESVEILYALRTLSARQRKTAADFVVKNSLNADEAQELAKAIKDHERRPQGREGFTTAAGDCLAFMYHRAAAESTDAEVRSAFVERGRRVAETDSAKQRFEKV
ncbi:hypothetical protein R1flu_022284 [Riccia fluitans]|uniref:Uncharacterized protein n=1 Tax=Riccia fluitans TaxID=41844 RepID=A0ABD1ZT24_9MARC